VLQYESLVHNELTVVTKELPNSEHHLPQLTSNDHDTLELYHCVTVLISCLPLCCRELNWEFLRVVGREA
jgi:hypothetical protein